MKKSSEYPVGAVVAVGIYEYTKLSDESKPDAQGVHKVELWSSTPAWTNSPTNMYYPTLGFTLGLSEPAFNPLQ